jgi:hypothetical protein
MAGSSLGVATSKGAGGVITLYPDNSSTAFTVAVGAIQSWTLKHSDDRTETRGTDGRFVGVSTSNNDTLTLNVTAVLSGTSAANALLSGKLPKGNGRASITGAEVIVMGPWTDAINVTAGSAPDTYFWVYQADGEISASQSGDDKTVSFTLKRYSTFAVTSAAAIAI